MFGKRKNITPSAPTSKRQTRQSNQNPNRQRDSSASSRASYSSAYSASGLPADNEPSHNDSSTSAKTVVPPTGDGLASALGNMKISRSAVSDFNFGGKKTGKMRDIIEVDILLIDGDEYKGNVTEMEVHRYVCRETLKIKRSEIVAIDMHWAGHPLVVIRLKSVIDIDSLPKHFSYNKPGRDSKGAPIFHKVVCDIRGVKDEGTELFVRKPEEPENGPWTRWVKMEGVGFDLTETQLKEWLSHFGELMTGFETETITFTDPVADSDDDENTDRTVTLSKGTLSCKMLMTERIPQLLPAYGKRVKIYYRGIEKQCTKCYETDHTRSECRSQTPRLWLDYVCEFASCYDKIPAKLYGKWYFQAKAHLATKDASPTNGQSDPQTNRT